MQRGTIDAGGNWEFFNPDQHAGALAVLIRPNRHHSNKAGDRDFLNCDVWVFNSVGELQAGAPQVFEGVEIGNSMIVKTLRDSIGMLMGPFTFQKIPVRMNREGWVVRDMPKSATGYAEADAYANRLCEAAAAQAAPPPAPPAPAAPAAQPMFEQAYAAPPAPPAAGGYAPPPPASAPGSVPPPPPPAA